ncbi:MAG: TadE/TadG family type IV pilus assembly protein, partial [Chloroflexota bacterium]
MKNQPVTASRSQTRQKKERGQGLVEFSLILPILLLVIFGIIDYGRVLFIFSDVANSIRDGSRNATLVGTVSGVERYRACDQITDDAQGILFGQIQSFHILYYDTLKGDETQTVAAAPAYETAIENATAGDVSTLATADFDCNTTAGVPDISTDTSDAISTGDLMVVVMEVRVEFLTPIMS